MKLSPPSPTSFKQQESESSSVTINRMGPMLDKIKIGLLAFASAMTLALSVSSSELEQNKKSQTFNISPMPNAMKGI